MGNAVMGHFMRTKVSWHDTVFRESICVLRENGNLLKVIVKLFC